MGVVWVGLPALLRCGQIVWFMAGVVDCLFDDCRTFDVWQVFRFCYLCDLCWLAVGFADWRGDDVDSCY